MSEIKKHILKANSLKKAKNNKSKDNKGKEFVRDINKDVATLFVGNLPINTKRVQLVKLFKDYGPVNSIRFRTAGGKVIFKHKMRKEAGTLNAYVLLKDADTAEKALSLNGTEFKGQHLRITRSTLAVPDAENEATKRTIFVGSLKYTANEEKLTEIFSNCGEIEYIRCLRDGEKGCKGVAYVRFKAADAVGLALELNGTVLDDRPIHVERYSVKKLGAREARENTVEKPQPKTMKKNMQNKKDNARPKDSRKPPMNKERKSENVKKSGYKGVKTNEKAKNRRNKKSSTSMTSLAKKIAPKAK